MTPPALKGLTVKGLRGATQLITIDIPSRKKITVIYGENGSGKSTLCDGLELLGNQDMPSLAGRGLGNKTQKYWHSISGSPSDLEVRLDTASGTCVATLTGAQVSVSPTSLQPRVRSYRRRDLSRLLEAEPGKRFDAIRPFVDLSAYEVSEENLRRLAKRLKADRDGALAAILENERSLEASWQTAGSPPPDKFEWAKGILGVDDSQAEKERQAINELLASAESIASIASKLAVASGLLAEAEVAVARTQEALEAAKASEHAGSLTLLAVLRAGAAYLEVQPSPTECPLCLSAEKVSTLASKVQERIALLDTLESAKRVLDAAQKDFERARIRFDSIEGELGPATERMTRAAESPGLPASTARPARPCPRTWAGSKEWLAETRPTRDTWEGEAKTRNAVASLRANVKQAWEAYSTKVAQEQRLARLSTSADAALAILEAERRVFSDAVLERIAAEVGSLYEAVHPGEGLSRIELQLDPKKRSSLEVSALFAGNAVPPGAYFSQSHLDTLGLCIVIALAKGESPDETILVLDDVLGSVDEPHVDRLIRLLHDESKNFRHCFITTHYRRWRERLRWGHHMTADCHLIDLAPWSLTGGVALSQALPEVTLLRAALLARPPDVQLIASKAGVVAEAVLEFLTKLYECRMPRRESGRYAIGELLGGIDSKLRSALKVELADDSSGVVTFKAVALDNHLATVNEFMNVRNLMGAHFSDLGMHLQEADAIAFGTCAAELFELVVHPEEGWPTSDRSGSYRESSGGSIRLHPLKRPQ